MDAVGVFGRIRRVRKVVVAAARGMGFHKFWIVQIAVITASLLIVLILPVAGLISPAASRTHASYRTLKVSKFLWPRGIE